MAQDPADNSLIWRSKSWDELKRLASTEQAGDLILAIRKFGRSDSLTANVTEDIWETGGTKTLLASAETMSVVSASTADDLGGTGANYIQVGGLDADYNLITETVTMDGTTPVTTTMSFLRVNRVRVVFSGTGKTNAGAITVTSSDTAVAQATIPAGESISQQSHFTVPAGYTAFTTSVVLSVYRASGGSGIKGAEVDTMVYVPAANTTYQTLRYGVRSDAGALVTTPPVASQTPEKSTVWFQATPDSNGTVVTSAQEIILLKGDYNLRTEI